MKLKKKLFLSSGYSLSDEKLSKLNPETLVSVSFKYPDIEKLSKYNYKKRLKVVRLLEEGYHNEVGKMLSNLESRGKIKEQRAFMMKIRIKFSDLNELRLLKFVSRISILKIKGIQKKPTKTNKDQYYNVVAKVRVEVEGVKKKKNRLELRMSLIKAGSIKDAKRRTLNDYKKYALPYLSVKGRIIHWKLIKILDLYETGISHVSEFSDKEGVEVYSLFVNHKKQMKMFDN